MELGAGIEQTVFLAIRATQANNSLMLIEEPEIHLHPHLLMQLTRYLLEHTTNQYVLATHSATLLDHPDAHVFSVTMCDGYLDLLDLRDRIDELSDFIGRGRREAGRDVRAVSRSDERRRYVVAVATESCIEGSVS